jgi:hypothetical protein
MSSHSSTPYLLERIGDTSTYLFFHDGPHIHFGRAYLVVHNSVSLSPLTHYTTSRINRSRNICLFVQRPARTRTRNQHQDRGRANLINSQRVRMQLRRPLARLSNRFPPPPPKNHQLQFPSPHQQNPPLHKDPLQTPNFTQTCKD